MAGHLENLNSWPKSASEERRKHARLKVHIGMALQVDGYSSPIQVSTEEISLGGCFIETMFTFAVGANLVATFWIGRTKLSVKGVVATNFPQVGNGIEFKDMDRDGQETLRLFLAASGEQPV